MSSLSSFGALILLLGAARRSSWANYARALAISLLENDPDKPGALRLRVHRNHSDGSPLLHAEGEMLAADLQARAFEALFLRLHLFDDYAHHGITEWKRAWREFLRLGNLLQFLLRFDFVSSIGLADEMYQPIFDSGRVCKSPIGADGFVPDQLATLLELVDAEVSDLCRAIARRRKILPEPGFELTNPQGEIVATAELAWPAFRIAVLLRHEADGAGHFEAEGWRVHMSELILGTPEMLLDLLPNEVSE